MDIQHGLYQWGINFTDSSLKQGFKEEGISLPMDTWANIQATWGGANAIGYPRFTGQTIEPAAPSAPILLATNTNWHIYSKDEQNQLEHILRTMFDDFANISFVWKPHPAEGLRKRSELVRLIDDVRQYPNRFSHVEMHSVQTESETPLAELVSKCRAGIATIGTAVLDFEVYGKPCVVYDCPAVSNLNAHLEYCDLFSTYAQLLKWLSDLDSETRPPITGQLKPYQPKALEALLAQAISASVEGRASIVDYRPIILKYYQLKGP